MALDPCAGEPPVGEHLVEPRHHLLFGHHRQFIQLVELEALRVDPSEAAGVKRGALHRADEQCSQPLALVLHQSLGVPAQALDVRLDTAGERVTEACA